jgi:hypothetical protein
VLILQIFQGFLTPVVAAIAVYIAYQQWQTNERKLKLDTYDRRLRVYRRLTEFLDLTTRDFKPDPREIGRFRGEVAEADFLFGPEIATYLAEVSSQASDSWRAHSAYRDSTQELPPGYNHQKVVEDMHERSSWLIKQHDVALAKFGKYLAINR